MSGRIAKQSLGWAVALVLITQLVGCAYDHHTNMGDTEKWIASDVHIVPKCIGLLVLPAFDAVVSPFTMSGDLIFRDKQYDPRHKYLSYAGSRTIGRSHMGLGYQIWCSLFTIPIETVWLIVTGPVDLITVLGWGDDGTACPKCGETGPCAPDCVAVH